MLEFTKMRKKGFLLIYDSISPKNNEKKYIAEGIYFLNNSVCIIKTIHEISYSQLKESFNKEEIKIAEKEDVKKLQKLINKKFLKTKPIKSELDKRKTKKIHNNLELKII